jgi:hypothetical protein
MTRRLALAAAALLLIPFIAAPVIIQSPTSAPPPTPFSEDFSGTLGDWTVDNGACFTIASEILNCGSSGDVNLMHWSGTPAPSTINQWICAEFTDFGGGTGYPGLTVRGTSGATYILNFSGGATTSRDAYFGYCNVDACPEDSGNVGPITIANGDTVCLWVSGTTTSESWGACVNDCTAGTDCGSGVASWIGGCTDLTFDGTGVTDLTSGTEVGVMDFYGSGSSEKWDNVEGGDIP